MEKNGALVDEVEASVGGIVDRDVVAKHLQIRVGERVDEDCVWTNDFADYAQALAAVTAW